MNFRNTASGLKKVSSKLTALFGSSSSSLEQKEDNRERPVDGRTLEEAYHGNSNVKGALRTLDNVRELLGSNDEKITLPGIAVVGDQSSGKSSTVESLTGISLPRGTGIVTRCPIVVQIRRLPTTALEAYCVARCSRRDGTRKEVKCSPEELSDVLMDLTGFLAGTNRGIVPTPITVTMYRHDCVELTVVDLPGITRNPVGDQPENIYQLVRNLYEPYLKNPSTVIMNVVTANTDFSTSESIMLSRKYDPKGERTLGAVTKIDRADPEIVAKLLGNKGHIKLGLGFIGVRNRTQAEADNGVKLEDIHANEMKMIQQKTFLANLYKKHPEKLTLASLARRLSKIQTAHLKKCFPMIRTQVRAKYEETVRKLNALPKSCSTVHECRDVYNNLIGILIKNLYELFSGKHFVARGNPSMHAIPRINEVLERLQERLDSLTLLIFSVEHAKSVDKALVESKGVMLQTFQNFLPVSDLLRNMATLLKGPLRDVVARTHRIVTDTCTQLCTQMFPHQAKLLQHVLKVIHQLIEDNSFEIEEELNTVQADEEDIFTMQPQEDMVSFVAATVRGIGKKLKAGTNVKKRAAVDSKLMIEFLDALTKRTGCDWSARLGSAKEARAVAEWLQFAALATTVPDSRVLLPKKVDLVATLDEGKHPASSPSVSKPPTNDSASEKQPKSSPASSTLSGNWPRFAIEPSVVCSTQLKMFVYWNIVRARVLDKVAHVVRRVYLRQIGGRLQKCLDADGCRDELVLKLLRDPEALERRRVKLTNRRNRLKECMDEMNMQY